MKQRAWLILFTTLFVAIVVFIFYWLRLQPIEPPERDSSDDIVIGSVTNPEVTFVNPKKGSTSPKIVIVEFSDFQCVACRQLSEDIDMLLRTEPDIQYVWKNMPNESIHPLSTPALAIAAHCAGEQGMFWQYHDLLFERQVFLSEQQFLLIAQDLGLDQSAFQNCYQSRETLPLVKRDFEEGLALGISAVPTVFINNERIVGALSYEQLLTKVRSILNEQ